MPVSTIPAERERMLVFEPYRICWSIPQNVLAGLEAVRGLQIRSGQKGSALDVVKGTYAKLIEPTNLEASVPPKVISPLVTPIVELGSNEMETRFCWVTPWKKRLSVTGVV